MKDHNIDIDELKMAERLDYVCFRLGFAYEAIVTSVMVSSMKEWLIKEYGE